MKMIVLAFLSVLALSSPSWATTDVIMKAIDPADGTAKPVVGTSLPGGTRVSLQGAVTVATPFVSGTPVANQTPLAVWSAVPNGFQGGVIQTQGSVAVFVGIGRGATATQSCMRLDPGTIYVLSSYEACQSLSIVAASSTSNFFARRDPSQ